MQRKSARGGTGGGTAHHRPQDGPRKNPSRGKRAHYTRKNRRFRHLQHATPHHTSNTAPKRQLSTQRHKAAQHNALQQRAT